MLLRHFACSSTMIVPRLASAPFGLLWILLQITALSSVQVQSNNVPAIFVFGDSMVDAGNNNGLMTLARANFPPYGRDFDSRLPTGRFSNGRLIPDFLASHFGLHFAPAYMLAGEDVLHGVNFASAGSGLLESTGLVFGQHISVPKQVENFGNVRAKITAKVGAERASEILSKSIYYITVGSNDIVNNYYLLPVSPISVQYNLQQFQGMLITEYQKYIQKLYDQGARKFVLASLTALGCSPINLLRYNVVHQGQCVDFLNRAASTFNGALRASVSHWSSALPGAHIVYANSFDYVLDVVRNPSGYGYQVSDKACCSGVGKNGAILFCLRNVTTCTDPSAYVYWDEFHPSSRIYGELANKFMAGSTEDSYPINVNQLAAL